MWSGMLLDLLILISSKCIVFYEDYFNFALVCKSWHSAAARGDYSKGLPSRFPSLLLAEKEKDGGAFRELFLLSNKSIRKIRLPEAYGKVCRSSRGWLVTGGDDHAAQLINPLTRETINLPSVDTFPRDVEKSRWFHDGIKKLLIVTNNPSSKVPLVVALWGSFDRMGFCRPGDNKWSIAGNGMSSGRICDLTYYNGRVYCFNRNYQIKACDVYGEDPTTLVDVSWMPSNLYNRDQCLCGAYIIGLDEGEKKRLVVVIRHMADEYWRPETYKTKRFLIFTYDLEDGRWSRLEDFGKKTLFVGHSSSFWIEDTTGVIKSNCIYFTDDVYLIYKSDENGGGKDMGIYHLSDGTIEPHFIGESRSLLAPPIWIQSV